MIKILEKILNFIILSSADPKKFSLSFKAGALFLVPFLMQAYGMVCAFGYRCIDIDPSIFDTVIDMMANLIFLFFSAVATVLSLCGIFRKMYRTFTGTNEVLK